MKGPAKLPHVGVLDSYERRTHEWLHVSMQLLYESSLDIYIEREREEERGRERKREGERERRKEATQTRFKICR